MARPLDYSKWNNIEISDDEDDTHPNIDKESLFRWRHQARVDRERQEKEEQEQLVVAKKETHNKVEEIQSKIAQFGENSPEVTSLKSKLTELEKQELHYAQKEADLRRQKELFPKWNVDNICKPGFDKVVLNKAAPEAKKPANEDEEAQDTANFMKTHEKEIKKYGMLQKFEDTHRYLLEHPDLANEGTANYLVLWAIELEIEGKHDLMRYVAHQTIVMQYILEVAKTAKRDPKTCVNGFFQRLKLADQTYMDAFNDEWEAFVGRVKARAKVRIEEATKQLEADERQQRLGPGGLDPLEVLEELPQDMRSAFEEKDMPKLHRALAALPIDEAKKWMKKCEDSGLWVPSKDTHDDDGDVKEEDEVDDEDADDAEDAAAK
eukprot:Opistho-2@76004